MGTRLWATDVAAGDATQMTGSKGFHCLSLVTYLVRTRLVLAFSLPVIDMPAVH